MPNLNRNLKLSVLKSQPSDSRLAATGKKPLSLLRQSSPSLASPATLGRGTRSTAPVKATANVMQRPGARSMNALNNSAMAPASLSLKKRPTTLSSTEVRTARVMTSGGGRTAPGATSSGGGRTTPGATTSGGGRTTPGATTPTSKAKPLVMSAKKTNVTTPPRNSGTTPLRNSGIPKPGSLTKLSIPQK